MFLSMTWTVSLWPFPEAAWRGVIAIKSADKGSGIVIEDTEQYVKDGLNHLSHDSIYERIDTDPTIPLTKAINTMCTQCTKRESYTHSQKNTSYLKLTPHPEHNYYTSLRRYTRTT